MDDQPTVLDVPVRRRGRALSWIFAAAIAGLPAVASADRTFDVTPLPQPNSPLEILSCDAKLTDTLGGEPEKFFYAGCHVMNHGDQTITAFQIVFVTADAFGTILGQIPFTVEGTYAHDVFVDLHNHAGGAYFEAVNTTPGVRSMLVLVNKVRFADGTVVTVFHKPTPQPSSTAAPL